MKTVSRIELRWTDGDGHEWTIGAAIVGPTTPERIAASSDMALDRLRMAFADWRHGK